MRNRFPGMCYRCGKRVEVGAGHFERFQGGWRTQHAECAIEFRGVPDLAREAANLVRLHAQATQTGKAAQKARKRLRDIAAADAS